MPIIRLAPGVYFEPVNSVSGRINPNTVTTLFVAGVTERGPIGVAPDALSFAEWQRTYGGYTVESADTVASVRAFFDNGGARCRTSRITHCTIPGDPTSTTSAAATIDLDSDNLAPTAGSTSSAAQPFDLEPGQSIEIEFESGGTQAFIVDATAASIESAAEPFTLADLQTFVFDGFERVIGVGEFADISNATAEEVAAILNPFFLANSIPLIATLTTGDTKVAVTTIQRGNGATFDLAGTAVAAMGGTWAINTFNGSGNVADVDNVTAAEVAALSGAITDGTVSAVGGVVTYTSATAGLLSTAQFKNSSTAVGLGFDTAIHTGSAGGVVPVWTPDGKYDGTYANALSVRISAPTNGDALSVDVEFLKNGTVVERWPNISADSTSDRFVETIINDAATGSQLLHFTDLGTGLTPAYGTFGPLTGGDDGLVGLVDADYIGSTLLGPPPSATGVRVFDNYDDGELLIVPGRATAGTHEAVIAYCEINKDTRLFYIADLPVGYSSVEADEYITTTAVLFNRTEVAATYWPWVKAINPDSSVFDGTTITIPPSGIIAGLCARIDSAKTGGSFDQPAGADQRYLPVGIVGFDTVTGESPTLSDVQRLFPHNVNVIRRNANNPIFVDGARTLSITGSWPSVGQSRGVIFVKNRISVGLAVLQHRNINNDLYTAADRIVTGFLNELTRAGAFASRNPDEAFLVNFGIDVNPPAVAAAREVHGDVGLATSTPNEFTVIRIGPLSEFVNTALAVTQ